MLGGDAGPGLRSPSERWTGECDGESEATSK